MPWTRFLPPPLPREERREEMMDHLSAHSAADLHHALRDLERVNRIFGNHALLTRHLERLLTGTPPGGEVSLLDIGTGGGDLPAVAARWAAGRGRPVSIVAIDRSGEVLEYAAERLRRIDAVRLLRADAPRLPFADRSFDVVFCSQLLHHLPTPEAIRVLAEMNRVSRLGWIVSDLRRGRIAHRLTRAAMRLASRSPMIRADGPLSILRAFTPEEYGGMAAAAGAADAEVVRHRFFRAAIVRRHPRRAAASGSGSMAASA